MKFSHGIPVQADDYCLVQNVPHSKVRRGYAHIDRQQFLVCVRGGLSVIVDDGTQKEEIRLDSSSIGLFLPAMTWCLQYNFS